MIRGWEGEGGPVNFLDALDGVLFDGGLVGAGCALLCILGLFGGCAVRGQDARHLVVGAVSRTRVVSHTVTEKQWECVLIVCSGHEMCVSC